MECAMHMKLIFLFSTLVLVTACGGEVPAGKVSESDSLAMQPADAALAEVVPLAELEP